MLGGVAPWRDHHATRSLVVESGCWQDFAGLASIEVSLIAESRIMAVPVDYYMTLNSPWTYLGSALFAEIATRNGVTSSPASSGQYSSRQAGCRYRSGRPSGAPTE
jgi:hypothetical protein